MKGALEAMAAQFVNVCLSILAIVVWMGLCAYLDAKPSETDAAQASALTTLDAIDDARVRARVERVERVHFATTTESQP
ncbi:hypothetical protein H4CHR_04424 [Variovorax sp. PBS-H4]|uniref:hypothetical protein n=1 Tax=Variovorax sp. PBS-H4 TaxID=434008 RepID=UPI001317845D|nr:hypothetical protein [Variovorax sp. PBS-H4]VTU38435.1 hypothetical protein H4CHR_04424 [Variovorax sp. PBS-H4]